MDRIKILSDKIKNLFSSEELTVIDAKELLLLNLNEWQYINPKNVNGEIEYGVRYKIIEKAEDYVVSITEWLRDDTFNEHVHNCSNEDIFVITGKVTSVLDYNLDRFTFGRISFKKGTIHKVKGKKGTLIAVKFTFV